MNRMYMDEAHISESLHLVESQVFTHEEILRGVVYETKLKWKLCTPDGSFVDMRTFKFTGIDHVKATIEQLQKWVNDMEKDNENS